MNAASTLLATVVLAASGLQEEPARDHAPPTRLYDVERVVDGDTIWIRRDGDTVKLRLLSVDTEEKLSFQGSDTKPGTVFGEETSLWAQELFAGLAADGRPPRVGLAFPDGREALDAYGRLLCHVVLPDGTDFNLLLVREGRSPYFNKYGNSVLAHEAFVAAQAAARAARRGIWNPETNAPRTPGAPSARRPYDELLPWWDLRARAVEEFRRRNAADPVHVVACDDPDALAGAVEEAGEPVRVFGLVNRTFEESDGSLTVLMRAGNRDRALRLVVPAGRRAAFADLDFDALNEPWRQNYVWVEGALERAEGRRGGFRIVLASPDAFRVAHPRAPAGESAPQPAGAGRD